MSISQNLAWELQAQADHGDASAKVRLSLQVAYGVALACDDPGPFSQTMESIASQVSDPEMKRLFQMWTRRGLR